MALAPRRKVNADDLDEHFAVNMAAERGGVLCASTTTGEAEYKTAPTGAAILPVGMLLDDVESLNYDRHPEYLQRNVVDIGSTVSIARKGELSTNLIVGSPTQGQKMYLAASGYVSPTQATDGITSAPLVGRFLTAKNAAGYADIYLDV